MIKAEREACADVIAGLSDAQLDSPSLCTGWSVRNLAGHMVGTAEMTPGAFIGGIVKNGFCFNVMVERLAKTCEAGGASDMANRLRAKAAGPNHPPGPVTAMLGEAVVHGEDLRRPLGLSRAIPTPTIVAVADFYKRSNLIIGAKRRIAGVHMRATDADWENGDGPEVSGPMVSLVMVMAGRSQSLGDLTGDGAATLAQRV
jgi:uncharacterized protein (TIGR03083 family)